MLFDDLGYTAGANGAAAFADSEAEAFLHSYGVNEISRVAHLPEGTEMVMPGDNCDMTVELIQPVAMDEGLRFAIREGGRTVGAGRVTKIIK